MSAIHFTIPSSAPVFDWVVEDGSELEHKARVILLEEQSRCHETGVPLWTLFVTRVATNETDRYLVSRECLECLRAVLDPSKEAYPQPHESKIMTDDSTQPVNIRTKAHTALTEKAYSPLIIRKTTRFGFPIFVALITDDDLDDLDKVVLSCVHDHIDLWKSDSIQEKRNLAGILSDSLVNHYERVEGVAVLMAIDKMMVSSLFGDFMNHTPCRLELYTLLNMMTNV